MASIASLALLLWATVSLLEVDMDGKHRTEIISGLIRTFGVMPPLYLAIGVIVLKSLAVVRPLARQSPSDLLCRDGIFEDSKVILKGKQLYLPRSWHNLRTLGSNDGLPSVIWPLLFLVATFVFLWYGIAYDPSETRSRGWTDVLEQGMPGLS